MGKVRTRKAAMVTKPLFAPFYADLQMVDELDIYAHGRRLWETRTV